MFDIIHLSTVLASLLVTCCSPRVGPCHACLMNHPQNAIKMKETGKLVKFGYAVFEERAVAEKLVKQGSLAIADGVSIKISPMVKN